SIYIYIYIYIYIILPIGEAQDSSSSFFHLRSTDMGQTVVCHFEKNYNTNMARINIYFNIYNI
ncbi:hypothetical protein BHE74_00029644, partial [Ensete ventricosum]